VISKDGLSLNASISARFQLQHDSVAQLHKFIGPDYPEILVSPVIGSRARDVISRFDAEQVYSTKRSEIQDLIQEAAEKHLMKQLDQLIQPESNEQLPQKPTDTSAGPASTGQSPPASTDQSPPAPPRTTILAVNRPIQVAASLHNAIQILDTLVLGIELPPPVVASINRKVEQYYIAQEYKFRVQREEWESTRKRTEATGIRDFQQIVSQGISDSYLRWRGIEATLQLAQSNNAKIVIIGSGKDGLPIILGNVDTPALPQTPAGAGTNPDAASRANPAAVPLEKTPPPGLPTPPDGKQAPPAAPDKPQSLLPRSLSEIQSMLSRFPANTRSTGPETGSSPP
jgi:regulator of protease activity HflC (stomatin/prohibitin superfamily)